MNTPSESSLQDCPDLKTQTVSDIVVTKSYSWHRTSNRSGRHPPSAIPIEMCYFGWQ